MKSNIDITKLNQNITSTFIYPVGKVCILGKL